MSARGVVLGGFLGVVLLSAGLLSTGWAVWWLAPVVWLGRFQAVHVVAHFSIFAGVVILYGPPRKIGRLALIVVSGGVLLELVQIAVSGFALSGPGLLDSAFDLAVDVMGAVVMTCVQRANGD